MGDIKSTDSLIEKLEREAGLPAYEGSGYRSGYAILAKELGLKEYHTAEIKTIDEARKVYSALKRIAA